MHATILGNVSDSGSAPVGTQCTLISFRKTLTSIRQTEEVNKHMRGLKNKRSAWRRRLLLLPIAFILLVTAASVTPSGNAIPVIPGTALLTDIPVYTVSGDPLPSLMDGIAPTDFPLEQFVDVREEARQCTALSRLANRISAMLPPGLRPITQVLAQSCYGCYFDYYYVNCYSAFCQMEQFPVFYSTGSCADCGLGVNYAAWISCTEWFECWQWTDDYCDNTEYCNCENCE